MSKTVFNALSRKHQYKYPYIFLGIYLTVLLSTVCLANKLTLVSGWVLPGGIFIFPFTFGICDIVGEVYGYAYPRLFIWVGIFSEFIFSIVLIAVSHTTAPLYFQDTKAYQVVFDPTFRYVVSGLIALLIGEFVNVYLLAKWKITLRGRFFILRSLLSTALGQACLTIIVDILNYMGKVPINDLVSMMISGYSWKLMMALLLIIPSWLLVKFLIRAENIDHYDVNTNFNPFILSLNENESFDNSNYSNTVQITSLN